MKLTSYDRKYIQKEIKRMRAGWYHKYEINDVGGFVLTHHSNKVNTRNTFNQNSKYDASKYLYNWILQNQAQKFI